MREKGGGDDGVTPMGSDETRGFLLKEEDEHTDVELHNHHGTANGAVLIAVDQHQRQPVPLIDPEQTIKQLTDIQTQSYLECMIEKKTSF